MKKYIVFWMFLSFFLIMSTMSFAQFDDLYYDPDLDGEYTTYVVDNDNDEYDDEYYDDEYYDDYYYDDYYYTKRIRRFHRSYYFDYYDPFFYDDYWYSPGISIYITSGYGYRPWYRYGYYNPWRYRRYGWGGYYSGYNRGYWNGYNDGFYDGYYGYGSYGYGGYGGYYGNYYGGYYGGYYGNYYGNGGYYYGDSGYYNNGKKKNYGSRHGISNVTSKKGKPKIGVRDRKHTVPSGMAGAYDGNKISDKKIDGHSIGLNKGNRSSSDKKWTPFGDRNKIKKSSNNNRGYNDLNKDRNRTGGNSYSPVDRKKPKSDNVNKRNRSYNSGFDKKGSSSSDYKRQRNSDRTKYSGTKRKITPDRKNRSNRSDYKPERRTRSSSKGYNSTRSSNDRKRYKSSSSSNYRRSSSPSRSFKPSSTPKSSYRPFGSSSSRSFRSSSSHSSSSGFRSSGSSSRSRSGSSSRSSSRSSSPRRK